MLRGSITYESPCKSYFTKRGYTNLIKENLPLFYPDTEAGEDIVEFDFTQNIIIRVNHGRSGQQGFRIELDTMEGFVIPSNERTARANTDGITHHYTLNRQ